MGCNLWRNRRLRERLVPRNFLVHGENWTRWRFRNVDDFVGAPSGNHGGGAAAVLFGVVAVIVSFNPGRIEASPLSYAVLGGLLSLGIIILPFAAWVAGGLLRALQEAQGTYLLLPSSLLPVAIAGLLTGWKVQSGRN